MNKQASNLLLLGLKTIIRQPKLIQLIFFWLPFVSGSALIVGGGFYLYETNIARPQMSYMGVPTTQNNWQNMTHVLRNKAYMLSYSERLANPLWVTYKVTNQTQKYGKRPPFTTDWRTLNRVSAKDYKFTGYNRGHLAPDANFDYNQADLDTVYTLANIIPQDPNVNRHHWTKAEAYEREMAYTLGELWVINGVEFENPTYIGENKIAVPKGFWKILWNEAEEFEVCLYYNNSVLEEEDDTLNKHIISCDLLM